MRLDNNQQAFIDLLRAGLWEKDVFLSQYGEVDYKAIIKLAEEQAVVGLIAAGLEHVADVKVPQKDVLAFVGTALQLEQRNTAMNDFVGKLINLLKDNGICALLVKGQGIARCYERPLWRAAGDIDLMLCINDYEQAKALLFPLSDSIEAELPLFKHLGMFIEGWEVELHGTMRTRLSNSVNRVVKEVFDSSFERREWRIWKNGGAEVFLPAVDNDIVFVFTHILDHFYEGGIGFRQICDLCRLVWRHQNELDVNLLEYRLKRMGVVGEWKSFAALAVYYLGVPSSIMPLYSSENTWRNKADKIFSFIIKVGNFGHNRDYSYINKHFYILRKVISLWWRTMDCMRHLPLFPKNTLKVWVEIITSGVKSL